MKKNMFSGQNPKNAFMIVLVTLFVASLVLHRLTDYSRHIKRISYSSFMNKVENNEVKWIRISGQEVAGAFTDDSRFEAIVATNPTDFNVMREHHVEIIVDGGSSKMGLWYLFSTLLFVLITLGIFYYIRQSRNAGNNNGGGNIFMMSKSKARMFMPSAIKENFNSVAGADEAKDDLQDIVDVLKNPEKYKRLGAKMTRGILLVGEPGNGKTLLARAVAGEATCPFFSTSGSDFIEVFVGVGAARVRDLFAQARRNAPSIIFIDEIDAVGRHRGSGLGGGNDEREQTLNQLLTEMDGFATDTTSKPVIIIAATNRPDVLDKALLRPGRFDRTVTVPYPDLKSRHAILTLHAKNVKLSADVDLEKIARGTPMFSGADLANLINEAAIGASKSNSDAIYEKDFEEARDKILIGKTNKSMVITEQLRRETAYHEAGHALMHLMLPDVADPLHKITIIPRGQALGVTYGLPEAEKYSSSKEEMLAKVLIALGGRAAEELVFNLISTGAGSDFQKATAIVRQMVCHYGMSESLGMVIYDYNNENYSQTTAAKIDDEIRTIIENCYKQAYTLLKDNRDKLEILAQALLEKETIVAAEAYELLGITPRVDHRFTSK